MPQYLDFFTEHPHNETPTNEPVAAQRVSIQSNHHTANIMVK